MPNTREKLIKLLCDVIETDGCSGHCNFPPCYLVKACADHLIANGVTVQCDKDINVPSKWISVKDRLPEVNVPVLTYDGKYVDGREFYDLSYVSKYGVTHWMPLPEPPKGE